MERIRQVEALDALYALVVGGQDAREHYLTVQTLQDYIIQSSERDMTDMVMGLLL